MSASIAPASRDDIDRGRSLGEERRAVSARSVVASATIHLVLVIALLAAGAAAPSPTIVEVEIVAPALVIAEPVVPPVVEQRAGGAPGGEAIARATPARHAEPVRKRPRAHRDAPPARPAGGELVPAPAAELAAPEPVAEVPPAAGPGAIGQGEGLGGDGTGTGRGPGTGDGLHIDESGPPVPLDVNMSATRFYTEAALRDRVSGDVSLELLVDPLGRVGRATVRRGLGHGLDEIATGIAMQLRFRPARDRAGKPIAGKVRWRFHFEPP